MIENVYLIGMLLIRRKSLVLGFVTIKISSFIHLYNIHITFIYIYIKNSNLCTHFGVNDTNRIINMVK